MAAATLAPSPAGKPIVGHLTDFSRDPLGFLTRSQRECGDIVRFNFMGHIAWMVTHPDTIEHILGPHHRDFRKPRSFRTPLLQALLGNGLVSSEGDFWVRQRRLAQPAFHRQRIAAYAQTMVEYADRMAATWQPGSTRDLHADMMRLTLEVVVKTLFNVELQGEADETGALMEGLMEQFTRQFGLLGMLDNMFPTWAGRRARKLTGQLDEIIFEIIRQRRAGNRDTGDLLSMLLHARDEDGTGMTDTQLRDETMTFFFAGHETTALTLMWTWYLLASHPEVEACLHAELDTILGSRLPEFADVARLEYTERVIKEAMRLFPPVWSMGREALEDCAVAGHLIRKGEQVFMPQFVVHRDPRFFPEPNRFDPDRWTEDRAAATPRYAYFPFGGGPRGCIGLQFSMMEAVLLLATLARRYRLRLVPGQDLTPWPTLTLRVKHGMQMTATPR